jgi:hypothetical protein
MTATPSELARRVFDAIDAGDLATLAAASVGARGEAARANLPAYRDCAGR